MGPLDFLGPIVALLVVGIAVTIFWVGALVWRIGALNWVAAEAVIFRNLVKLQLEIASIGPGSRGWAAYSAAGAELFSLRRMMAVGREHDLRS